MSDQSNSRNEFSKYDWRVAGEQIIAKVYAVANGANLFFAGSLGWVENISEGLIYQRLDNAEFVAKYCVGDDARVVKVYTWLNHGVRLYQLAE